MNPSRAQTCELARLQPAAQLAAIGSAWPHASATERREFAWLLIQLAAGRTRRGETPGRPAPQRHEAAARAIGLLAVHWAAFDTETRSVAVAAGRGNWSVGLGALSELEILNAGRSLAELATDSDDPALLPVLGRVLQSATGGGVQAAARALLVLSFRHASPVDPASLGIDDHSSLMSPPLDPVPPVRDPADVRRLLEVVASGVEGYDDHGRKDVLLAALVLLEGPRWPKCPADPLAAIARDSGSAAFSALRTAFRKGRVPLARHRAWLWLREESLAAACLDRLGRASTAEDHRLVLEFGHLCLAPARSQALAIVSLTTGPAAGNTRPPDVSAAQRLHPGGVVPDRAVLAGLPAPARRRFPAFVAALRAADGPTTLALEPLLVDPDPVARLAACRTVPRTGAPDWCFDAHPVIARHAALRNCALGIAESSRARAGDPHRCRAAGALVRSPHAVVRRIGQRDLDRLTPGGRAPLSRLAARRLWLSDPSAFADWVRTATDDSAAAGVEALMAVRAIRAAAGVETLLLSIVRDSMDASGRRDPKLVATAVACLGGLTSTRAVSVLEGCLARHADPRVRSNAAEALGRLRRLPGVHAQGAPKDAAFADEHHRVRASVVRAALAAEPKPAGRAATTAVEVVSDMLTDPRPSHRLAGVWVVQRSLGVSLEPAVGMKWERVVGRIRWLADEDGDEAIRRRAGLVTHRVNAAMQGLGPRSSGVLSA